MMISRKSCGFEVQKDSKSDNSYAEEHKDDLDAAPEQDENPSNSEEELGGLANYFETKLKVIQEKPSEEELDGLANDFDSKLKVSQEKPSEEELDGLANDFDSKLKVTKEPA